MSQITVQGFRNNPLIAFSQADTVAASQLHTAHFQGGGM
jgi:hypothetical protein